MSTGIVYAGCRERPCRCRTNDSRICHPPSERAIDLRCDRSREPHMRMILKHDFSGKCRTSPQDIGCISVMGRSSGRFDREIVTKNVSNIRDAPCKCDIVVRGSGETVWRVRTGPVESRRDVSPGVGESMSRIATARLAYASTTAAQWHRQRSGRVELPERQDFSDRLTAKLSKRVSKSDFFTVALLPFCIT